MTKRLKSLNFTGFLYLDVSKANMILPSSGMEYCRRCILHPGYSTGHIHGMPAYRWLDSVPLRSSTTDGYGKNSVPNNGTHIVLL